jgi:SP family general alpha glucoside:H+ symporter-like MFS transporter
MNPTHSTHGEEKYGEEKDIGGHALHATTSVSEKEVTEEARMATSKEHNLTVRQGIKAYKKAIGWSILLSSAVIMEGYDTILVSPCHLGLVMVADPQIGSYLGLPAFNNTFGNQVVDGTPSITAPWQAAGG